MRVLLVTGSLPPLACGVGDYTALLARALAEQAGLTVGVLSGPADGVRAIPGVEILPPLPGWGPGCLRAAPAAARAWRPDLIHVQYPTRGYQRKLFPYWLPAALRGQPAPVVQSWHEPLFPRRTVLRYFVAALVPGPLVVMEPGYLGTLPAFLRPAVARKRPRLIQVPASIPPVSLTGQERAALREAYGVGAARMVAHFGRIMPAKGVELLFEIADPATDRLVLIGDLRPVDRYQREVLSLIEAAPWRGRVAVTGYLEAEAVGALLAAADVAVFPFRKGVAMRNTSFLAARQQGVYIVTTSLKRRGYDARENVFYAAPDDVGAMRQALGAERPSAVVAAPTGPSWPEVAAEHLALYAEALADRG